MNSRQRPLRRMRRQRGQAFLLIVVFIGLFLLGMLGLATDYTQIWARRQMAQGAADAACQAGAGDRFIKYANPDLFANSWIGSDFNCSTNTTSSPCVYASRNGYTGTNVAITWPTAASLGISELPSGFGAITNPIIKVAVTDSVPLSFTRIFNSSSSLSISASAACGLQPVSVPVPLVVLHQTAASSLNVSGNPTITIYGGPNRSIQVDSSSDTALSAGGSSLIDLTHAGPTTSGADIGVFGSETQPSTTNVQLGSGKWVAPALPYGDPWITVSEPAAPALASATTYVTFGTDGCPDPSGCAEFSPGNYALGGGSACKASGAMGASDVACLILPTGSSFSIPNWHNSTDYTVGTIVQPNSHNAGNYIYQVQTAGTSQSGSGPNPWNQTISGTQADGTVTWVNLGTTINKPKTGIFKPGLYYVGVEGLQLASNSTVRMSTAAGDGTNGVTFFFSSGPGSGQNLGTINVGSNAGNAAACNSSLSPNGCIVSYKPAGTTQTFGSISVASRAAQCPGGASVPSQVPATIDGNILLGPCSGTYGDSTGQNRGFLFFQKRSTAVTAGWSGGGQFLLSGFMYFHNSAYGSTLSLSGNSGAGAYTLGNIVADKVTLGGTSGINMILNPTTTYQILRPTLLR